MEERLATGGPAGSPPGVHGGACGGGVGGAPLEGNLGVDRFDVRAVAGSSLVSGKAQIASIPVRGTRHQIAFLLRRLSTVRTCAIVKVALLQHAGQDDLILVHLLDSPFETIEGIFRHQGWLDHVDFTVTTGAEFRGVDLLQERPFLATYAEGIPTTAPAGDQEHPGGQAEKRTRRTVA